ncbi:MAG: hypothetical protein A6F70_01685 [Cycloclasticus sp. symbiont of Bathymodiolus heckerae]|nr:MAG: hypothetical protein A6F70_01685 [Cycloclasticus sp. symbiont of Bathymodiolus heckerae]
MFENDDTFRTIPDDYICVFSVGSDGEGWYFIVPLYVGLGAKQSSQKTASLRYNSSFIFHANLSILKLPLMVALAAYFSVSF